MTALNLTTKLLIAAGIIAAAAFLNQRYIVNPAVNAETARWNERWAARNLKDEQFNHQREKENRDTERSWQSSMDRLQSQAELEKAQVSARLAAATAERNRLQLGIRDAIAKLQRESADSSPASGGTPAATTGVLLAQLFGEIDHMAEQYATQADSARAAGLICEKAMDSLRAKK